jgi:mono/diheme cytochrome c family protein
MPSRLASVAVGQLPEETMNPIIHGAAARLALAVGLAAGAGLVPSASTAGAEPLPGVLAAPWDTGPARIHLAQAEADPGESPVSYASDQADRGEDRYKSECEECHGDDLRGGLNGGAPLRGVAFEQKFADGLPASLLFAFMSSEMPPNAPGRFSPSAYADLMAYILKRNGFRAGAPLPSEPEALEYLIMEK